MAFSGGFYEIFVRESIVFAERIIASPDPDMHRRLVLLHLRERLGVVARERRALPQPARRPRALDRLDAEHEAALLLLDRRVLRVRQRARRAVAHARQVHRVAAEGLVAIAVAGAKGSVVELNAETDFVARNTEFQGFASIFQICRFRLPGSKCLWLG